MVAEVAAVMAAAAMAVEVASLAVQVAMERTVCRRASTQSDFHYCPNATTATATHRETETWRNVREVRNG